MPHSNGWIGVDLDGTLAHYDGWKGEYHIGDPVPKMVARIKKWLDDGVEVRIMTARVSFPNGYDHRVTDAIMEWCTEHIGVKLAVTCSKDFQMIELWDDRCVQVVPNTGERIDGK